MLLFVWGGNRASRVWLLAPVGAVAADPCASFTRTCRRPHLFTGLTEAQCALMRVGERVNVRGYCAGTVKYVPLLACSIESSVGHSWTRTSWRNYD